MNTKFLFKMNIAVLLLVGAYFILPPLMHSQAHAAGLSGHSHAEDDQVEQEQKHEHGHNFNNIGEEGHTNDVRRTIKVTMGDNFYKPNRIRVTKGETIRFIVSNKGELVHEFNIGTQVMHQAHQTEMLEMVNSGALQPDSIDHSKLNHSGMSHDDPNSVLLAPHEKGEIIWKFSEEATIEFACNIPGHYENGMVGQIQFSR